MYLLKIFTTTKYLTMERFLVISGIVFSAILLFIALFLQEFPSGYSDAFVKGDYLITYEINSKYRILYDNLIIIIFIATLLFIRSYLYSKRGEISLLNVYIVFMAMILPSILYLMTNYIYLRKLLDIYFSEYTFPSSQISSLFRVQAFVSTTECLFFIGIISFILDEIISAKQNFDHNDET